jgi:hypothetical protein
VRITATARGALRFAAGDTLVIDLGDVAADAAGTLQFQAIVDAGQNCCSAELNAVISDDIHGEFDWFWVQHDLDGEPPSGVAILAPLDYVRPFTNAVLGTAEDASGVTGITLQAREMPSGVLISIACSVADGGGGLWACPWNAGDLSGVTAFDLRARADDPFGNTSEWSDWLTLPVDITPPVVMLDAGTEQALQDGLVGPDELKFGGQVADDVQADGLSACLEQVEGSFCTAVALQPGAAFTGTWLLDTRGFQAGDGISQMLIVRGIDKAGNLSLPLTRTYIVDTVAPILTVTQVFTWVMLSDYRDVAVIGGAVLSGTVSDGGGVSGVYVRLETPSGDVSWPSVTFDGAGWQFTPHLQEEGRHRLIVEVYDHAGNVSVRGPFTLHVVGRLYLPLVCKSYTVAPDLSWSGLMPPAAVGRSRSRIKETP